MLRIGDWHEAADWFTTPQERRTVEHNIRATFQTDAENNGIVFSPIEIHEMAPGESRVPEGPLGARMLRGSARIVALLADEDVSIINDIDPKDLEKLRDMTQKIWRKTNPKERLLKDSELDRVINERGTDVIERMLSEG